MSIKIHHGVPGSYKTSSAIETDFIPAFLTGRTIITNVRGLCDAQLILKILKNATRFNFKKIYNNLPSIDDVEIIYIDTESSDNLEHLRNFIHWAPHNAFFLIDEINTVFPVAWRETKLKEYDYKGGIDQAKIDDRPPNLVTAFEKHRHFNWDFVVTTPNISKVHSIVRDCAEMSYYHRNRATIGLKGSYWLIVHASDTTGKNKQDQLSYTVEKVPSYVFKMYKSTATGKVRDTLAGFNLFTQPKVVGFALFMVLLIGYNLYGYSNSSFYKSKNNVVVDQVDQKSFVENNNSSVDNQELLKTGVNDNRVKRLTPLQDYVVSVLDDENLYYSGKISSTIILQKTNNDDNTVQTFVFDLNDDLNIKFRLITQCFIEIKYLSFDYYYRCAPREYIVDDESKKLVVL